MSITTVQRPLDVEPVLDVVRDRADEADQVVRSTSRPSASRSAASESAWLRMAPAGHILRETAFAIAR